MRTQVPTEALFIVAKRWSSIKCFLSEAKNIQVHVKPSRTVFYSLAFRTMRSGPSSVTCAVSTTGAHTHTCALRATGHALSPRLCGTQGWSS